MPPSSLEIVSNFCKLLEEQKYEEAAVFLVDDFQFLTLKQKFDSKSDWLQNFPEAHKKAPTFEDPIPGGNDKQVLRKGNMQVGSISFDMTETYELNDEGKIIKISGVSRA
jgi:hypothetical protein